MMLNLYFNNLMKQIFDICLTENYLPELRPELQILLDQGFAEYDACYFFKFVLPKDFGETKFAPYVDLSGIEHDETSYEYLYNQLLIKYYLPEWSDDEIEDDDFKNGQLVLSNINIAMESKMDLIQQSIVATFETVRLISHSLPGSFRIILYFSAAKQGGKDILDDPRIRFYKIREGQTYFDNDLNNFKTNPMLAIDIDDSPQTQQFLQHHTNLEILKKFINLPDRNIMP